MSQSSKKSCNPRCRNTFFLDFLTSTSITNVLQHLLSPTTNSVVLIYLKYGKILLNQLQPKTKKLLNYYYHLQNYLLLLLLLYVPQHCYCYFHAVSPYPLASYFLNKFLKPKQNTFLFNSNQFPQ